MTVTPLALDETPAPVGSDRDKAERLHHYIVEPGGLWMPGATTIAGLPDDGEGLKRGAAKETARIALFESHLIEEQPPDQRFDWLKSEYDRRWKLKGDLGTRVHNHALEWAKGLPVDEQPDETPRLDALARFIETEVLEWIALERVVGCQKHGYGARLDFIARLVRFDGAVTLGDWKTGNRTFSVLKDALQLVGIAHADGFVVYDDKGMLTGFDPLPEIEHLVNVYLTPEGTYQVYETPPDDSLLTLFHACCTMYHARSDAKKYLRSKGFKP